MNTQDKYPDGPPCVESVPIRTILRFEGGELSLVGMRASHNGPTPTTVMPRDEYEERMVGFEAHMRARPDKQDPPRNTKLTRPAEQYPGEAERMIAEMTRGAISSIQRARDATDSVRLRVELEEAAWFIAQARRWATP